MSASTRRRWLQLMTAGVVSVAAAAWGSKIGLANSEPAVMLVQRLSDTVLDYLRRHPVVDEASREALVAFVEKTVLPHLDMVRITSLAVGPAWRQATPGQRERLVAEFQKLLLRTYSNAAKAYRDERLEFAPLRAQAGEPVVRVAARIIRSGAEPIEVQYVLEERGGSWKIIDVVIAGVSLVTNYRTTFTAEIHRSGIDGLITLLAEKNARRESDPVPGTREGKSRG